MPYCEILSSRFLHMDLASSVCTSKLQALNSISQYNNVSLINSKDENFFGYHRYYRTGYLTSYCCHKELGYHYIFIISQL